MPLKANFVSFMAKYNTRYLNNTGLLRKKRINSRNLYFSVHLFTFCSSVHFLSICSFSIYLFSFCPSVHSLSICSLSVHLFTFKCFLFKSWRKSFVREGAYVTVLWYLCKRRWAPYVRFVMHFLLTYPYFISFTFYNFVIDINFTIILNWGNTDFF